MMVTNIWMKCLVGKAEMIVCSQLSLSAAPEGKPCRQSALFQLAEVKQSVGKETFFKQTWEQFSNSVAMKRTSPGSDRGGVMRRMRRKGSAPQ